MRRRAVHSFCGDGLDTPASSDPASSELASPELASGLDDAFDSVFSDAAVPFPPDVRTDDVSAESAASESEEGAAESGAADSS